MDIEEKLEKMEDGKKLGEEELTIEEIFESKDIPPLNSQITARSILVSIVLGFLLTFTVMKLHFTTGMIPCLDVAAGLLGFFFIKLWTSVCSKFGVYTRPFTRQENSVIQTCVVATSGIAFCSGYASFILGMTKVVADQGPAMANTANNVVTLNLGWMICFLAVVSFAGLFSILPLRKIMILDYKLPYPCRTVGAYFINRFHTPKGAKLAEKQARTLFKWSCGTFVWGFLRWFFTAAVSTQNFYIDLSSTYVFVGIVYPYSASLSMLLGFVVSRGIMWPLIEQQEGKWYSADLNASSLSGLQGYKVFIALSMILGHGLFKFVVVQSKTVYDIIKLRKKIFDEDVMIRVGGDPYSINFTTHQAMNYDDQRRAEYFLKDDIPLWVAVAFYVGIAPFLTFCDSYGCGLSHCWSLASTYGKIAIFIFGSWVGLSNGGIVSGLAACSVVRSILWTSSNLMQNFKTGYLTLASPRSMLFSTVIGTLSGVIMSPLVFWIFFHEPNPNLGLPDSLYPAPYGALYRGIALIAMEGVSALPKNCLMLSIGFFSFAVLLNIVEEVMKHLNIKAHEYVPSAIGMAIQFYLGGGYSMIFMCVGILYKFWREWNNKAEDGDSVLVEVSGMICGDFLWGISRFFQSH
ncbi:hypothetical protein MKW92_034495 [Papaver armeniacum]|nr:hypothetical protein MKW92_034495 [Papaver armeniacum]